MTALPHQVSATLTGSMAPAPRVGATTTGLRAVVLSSGTGNLLEEGRGGSGGDESPRTDDYPLPLTAPARAGRGGSTSVGVGFAAAVGQGLPLSHGRGYAPASSSPGGPVEPGRPPPEARSPGGPEPRSPLR